MERDKLAALDGRVFDCLVIGGGVNGASAAHHLAAEGYSVLLADKGDYGAGSSSRSSRLLHCGLRFIEPGEGLGYRQPSIWEPLLKPRQFLHNLSRARDAMGVRTQIASTMPERVHRFTFGFPVWKGDFYKPWHVSAGMTILNSLKPKDGIPLGAKRIPAAEALSTPLYRWLRRPQDLKAVMTWQEYRYEWPERIVMDTILDAHRMGALARNYTAVDGLKHEGGRWVARLSDTAGGEGTARIEAKAVVNTGGIWIDRVNKLAGDGARRRIMGTKGCHIMVRLPEDCAPYGVCAHTTAREPLYMIPWRGMHYFGPTDTAFEGDIDDITATEEEIEHLVGEANALVPGAGIKRKDVLFSWAGVRPLTYSPDEPMGLRGHRLHDLSDEGMPNAFAMTSSPIQSHRLAGRQISEAVKRKVEASGRPQQISYGAKPFPPAPDSPPLMNHWDGASRADLRHAARNEQPVTLVDLLFRRVGAGWTETMGREAARLAAEEVAEIMGWDEARIEKEVDDYRAHVTHLHGVQ